VLLSTEYKVSADRMMLYSLARSGYCLLIHNVILDNIILYYNNSNAELVNKPTKSLNRLNIWQGNSNSSSSSILAVEVVVEVAEIKSHKLTGNLRSNCAENEIQSPAMHLARGAISLEQFRIIFGQVTSVRTCKDQGQDDAIVGVVGVVVVVVIIIQTFIRGC
jgi:hypothetical protein